MHFDGQGELKEFGSTREIIGKYLSNDNNITQSDLTKIKNEKVMVKLYMQT